MSFGLETYDGSGNVLSSVDESMMTYFGGKLISPNPDIGQNDFVVNRISLGPEHSYSPWVASITITEKAPTYAWDITEQYVVNKGEHIEVISSKYDSVYVTVGRF